MDAQRTDEGFHNYEKHFPPKTKQKASCVPPFPSFVLRLSAQDTFPLGGRLFLCSAALFYLPKDILTDAFKIFRNLQVGIPQYLYAPFRAIAIAQTVLLLPFLRKILTAIHFDRNSC